LYAANAHDRDTGKSGIITYRLASNSNGGSASSTSSSSTASQQLIGSNLFNIDSRSGHLTLTRHLDYETAQRHSLIVTASDSGEPMLSANLTILVEVQDVNDNPPVFERNEYTIKVLESMPVNSQVNTTKINESNNKRNKL
jgi:protocadherin-16/23